MEIHYQSKILWTEIKFFEMHEEIWTNMIICKKL